MSSCRCDDIRVCEDHISLLSDAEQAMNNQVSNINSIASTLLCISVKNLRTFSSPYMAELNTNVKELHVDMSQFRQSFTHKIQNRLDELRGELAELEAEDEDFHESEEDDDEVLNIVPVQ